MFSWFNHNKKKEQEKIDDEICRVVCSRIARGNASLKGGRYMTPSQMEERRLQVLSYEFKED